MKFGRRLAVQMGVRRVTVRALAETIGRRDATISDWRRGVSVPSITDLALVRAALGCTWVDLLGPESPVREAA